MISLNIEESRRNRIALKAPSKPHPKNLITVHSPWNYLLLLF